jgi:hypothetical protein
MKDFNREEYNKLCAEFLGWKEDFAHETDKYGYIQTIDGYMTPFINSGGHESNRSIYIHSTSQLKFDSDWNWIMEVVDKIENEYKYLLKITSSPTLSNRWFMHTTTIQNNRLSDLTNDKYIVNYQSDYSKNESKKDAVVQAIWEFLNWHKENK